MTPLVKWPGGKGLLLKQFDPLLPTEVTSYCEPFVGGGAMFFNLRPTNAVLNDDNTELINMYQVVRDNVEELIATLEGFSNTSDCYYEVRNWDRLPDYGSIPDVKKAARFIYLNKVCYNGLYRVNKRGQFNVSFGNHKNPDIVCRENLLAVSEYFKSRNIQFMDGDFWYTLSYITPDTFVYLDPPYDPISDTSDFTRYTTNGFTRLDQIRLSNYCKELNNMGVKFMLSNSDTPYIRCLYEGFNITEVQALRKINTNGSKRGRIPELVIRNYE